VASQCIDKSVYAYESLIKAEHVSKVFGAPFFREFVVKPGINPGKLNEELLSDSIVGGYDLSKEYPELEGCYLVAVTEKRTKDEIDFFVDKVNKICEGGILNDEG
jgi:glycine dehydrogenase subunit 1